MPSKKDAQIDFGFQTVPVEDKQKLVGQVFDSVADNYDLMNDVMSFGMHRLWKRSFISSARIQPGQQVLDLASGTGDIAGAIAKKLQGDGLVIASDINLNMLNKGRERLMDEMSLDNLRFVVANAQALPFSDEQFDLVTIAFGLRNVTDKQLALQEMRRVLKVGGHCLVMDFSEANTAGLKSVYDAYSFKLIPKMGEWIAKDRESYQYLVESIRKHPNQAALKAMLETAGFACCKVQNLSGGIVAIHSGVRID